MLTVILSITAIINFAAIIATYKPQAKYRNGMLFAVALPAHAVDHPGIRDIQAGFVRRMNRTILVTLAASVPFAVLHFWPVYQIIYFLVWLPVFSVALVVPFRRAFRETLALKREHEWFVGSNRIIAGDLRVAHLKTSARHRCGCLRFRLRCPGLWCCGPVPWIFRFTGPHLAGWL
ncbi:hypothetical protein PACILC2_29040 [Paenibacillus cisolokensis]|uniref:Uncharacterized protein n=1 Tax=Paenibacillus cisolokensis TaxID=1658519 RepID=A0ABQ4N8T6_9BACL|nr:hypothetical protein PACILC2_29040 [Paenibacillus cisolokensis]